MGESFAYVHARPSTINAHGIFYVGKGSLERSKRFYKRNPHHSNIVSKYGKENILVGTLPCSSEEIAFELEKGLIKCLRRMNVVLSNQTDGGEGFSGGRHTENSKKAISQAVKLRANEIAEQNKRVHTGKKRSEETCKRIAAGNLGKTHSEETRNKLSLRRAGYRWMTLHGKTRQVLTGKIELYLNNGWKFGRVNPKERSV